MDYKLQQIVWAKVVGYPYWPAMIVDEMDLDTNNPSSDKLNKEFLAVSFLGDGTNAWIEKKFIYPYEENREKYCRNSKKPVFLRALEEADDHIQKQKTDDQYQVVIDRPIKRKRKSVGQSSPRLKKVKGEVQKIKKEDDNKDDLNQDLSRVAKHFGVVGIGGIGKGIVKTLVKSGQNVSISNRTNKTCNNLKKHLNEYENLTTLLTPRAVLRASDIVFVCVASGKAATMIIENEFEAKNDNSNLLKNKGIVMITTIGPERSAEMYEKIKNKGGRYLELALQGSRKEAEEGTLTLLTAGDESLFYQCQPCFEIIGSSSYYFGKVGFAFKINLILQTIKGVSLGIFADALSLAERIGVPLKSFVDIFKKTDIASTFLNDKATLIIENNYACPQQPLTYMQKDLRMTLSMSDSVEQHIPLLNTALEIYKYCERLKYGGYDVCSVFVRK